MAWDIDKWPMYGTVVCFFFFFYVVGNSALHFKQLFWFFFLKNKYEGKINHRVCTFLDDTDLP